MRARQTVFVAVIAMDVEAVDAIHALKFLEAIERYLAGSGNELKQLGTLLLVERSHSSPEPVNLRRRRRVVVVLSVCLPVIDIDIGQTRYEKFQFLFVKD